MNSSLSSIIKKATNNLFSKEGFQSIDKFFSQDYVVHLTNQNYSEGYQLIQANIAQIRKAFPKPKIEIEILIESRDRVAGQITFTSIQKRNYYGFPACHQQLKWQNMVVSHVKHGLIVEEWLCTDLAE